MVEMGGRWVWAGAVMVGMDCEWAEAATPEVVQLSLGDHAWVVDTRADMPPSYHAALLRLLRLLFNPPRLHSPPPRPSPPPAASNPHPSSSSHPSPAATAGDVSSQSDAESSSSREEEEGGAGPALLHVIGFAFARDLLKLAALAPSLAPLLLPPGEEGPSNLVDLQRVASAAGWHPPGPAKGLMSLRGLAERLLNMTLDKAQQCSAWEQRPLDAAQLRYAALDARLLSHHLLPRLLHSFGENHQSSPASPPPEPHTSTT